MPVNEDFLDLQVVVAGHLALNCHDAPNGAVAVPHELQSSAAAATTYSDFRAGRRVVTEVRARNQYLPAALRSV
jgi:hypothetical protein